MSQSNADSPYDLIIFDCDGVLVDSEVISCRVHAEVLTRHGYPITAEQVRERFLGRSARDSNLDVERELGRPLPEAYDSERRQLLLEALAEAAEAIPHIHDALDAIDARMCVASSGAHEKIFTTLSRAGLYTRFAPHIFSASQVKKSKPAPDLFLFAAGQMKVEPARCFVIEDSVSGVTAARAAGMTVIGFVGGGHCRPGDEANLQTAGATVVIDDMRALPGLLARAAPPHMQAAAPI
ncbi:HAD family hydrolase [Bradyrhizobium sp. SYSU BS000235]|uniref:HAD family hydrolase n=1 Tax=Bradyrhizobium sp. SYSU BS000235 TaxID=3411332 RepID=UPI003C73B16B